MRARIGRQWTKRGLFLCVPVLLIAVVLSGVLIAQASTGGADWTTYGYSNARDGYNPSETVITPSTVHGLKLKWTHHVGGSISSQAIVNGSSISYGSWDGYEHGLSTSNTFLWSAYLGTTTSACGGLTTPFGPLVSSNTIGVASTGTVASVNGSSMLFVGGGNGTFYALNPTSGKVVWSRLLGSTSTGHFIWSSPAVYNGNVYVGLASIGDCPLIQGEFVEMSAATGAILHTFATVPSGCSGGSVWGAPAVDEAAGTIYFTTGNPGSCGTSEIYAEAIVEVNASDLSFVHHWAVPSSQRLGDTDFGVTPTLFQATIGGTVHNLVGAPNKNGIYYAWDRANISNGPIWQDKIASGGSCPQCDQGSISMSAWDGSTLYISGGGTTINGVSCKGSVRAVNPASGAYLWQHCLNAGPVLGALTAVPGLVFAAQGTDFNALNSATGQTLFFFHNTDGMPFDGGVTISNGVLYAGNMDGNLFAFAP